MSYGYGFRTDNPLADHARWVMEQERLAAKLPTCDICGRPIDDHYYNLYGEKYGYPVISKEIAHAVNYARKGDTKSGRWYMKKFNGELMYNGKKSSYNHEKWKFLLESDFKIDSACCDVMKKKPAKQYSKRTERKPIIGTMADESRLRKQKWIQNGCNAFTGKNPSSQPLSFWTEQDVPQYIKKYEVPYCPVYGDIIPVDGSEQIEGQLTTFDLLEDYQGTQLRTTGCNRTGCMFCMFGCHLEKEPNRFQRLKETHPRQYQYCIGGGEMVDGKWQPSKEGLGLGHVLDYINVEY